MSIDATSFKIRFPEFDAVLDARIDIFLADAIIILNETYWDTKYDMGVSYLTAHYLALANKSEVGSVTSSGPIASKTVDGASVAYTNATPDDESDAYYASTTYGQRYLTLRKTLGVPAFSV